MLQAVEALRGELGLRRACAAIGYSRATWHRHRKPTQRQNWPRAKFCCAMKLSPEERAGFLHTAHSPEFVDKSPPQIYFSLLDAGCYICSIRTMYRILADEGELKERRNQLSRPRYRRPELLATGPNQLWSWDITKLRGPGKGTYFFLYVVIDVYSRYVVGWLVAFRESEELAARLLESTFAKHDIQPGQLTVHADRGACMTSNSIVTLLEQLQVHRTHSRPCVSDDNPYSEAHFRTLKYRPDYPDRFGSLEDARAYARELFAWYNHEHYHSGICWLRPYELHYGHAERILATRHNTLMSFYRLTPERFRRGPPRLYQLPRQVWINQPYRTESTQADL
jgi:putative transposase